ncbi:MAG: COG1361 S-layer family protein, partial [Halodesulfurarchaeum sp.]
LGMLEDGQQVLDEFAIRVPQNVESGTYYLPIELEYVYDDDEEETTTVYAEVTVEKRASFSVVNVTDDLSVGEDGTVSVTLENDGTENLTDATVDLQSRSENLVFGSSETTVSHVGDWDAGVRKNVTVNASSPSDADPGNVSVSTQVSYEDTEGFTKQSSPMNVALTVDPDVDQFSIGDVQETLEVGEDGSVSMTLTNDGEEVTDAVVRLGDTGTNVEPLSSQYAVGTMAGGDSRNVSFPIDVTDRAEPTPRQFSFTVSYTDRSGDERVSDALKKTVEIEPDRDQFSLQDVEHSLRVGEEGNLSMNVTNDGEPVTDAVIRLSEPGMNVHPLANEYALGTMGSGTSTAVDFPIEISEDAKATPRQFQFTIAYDDEDGEERVSDPLNVQADIEPERDRFEVTPLEATVEAGDSTTITVDVTNNGNTTVNDVNAKIFTNDPLSSSDDEAYVEELAPGESDEIAFSLSAEGSAIEKQYPLSMDFQYDSNGDSKLSKSYQVPVSVVEPESTGPPTWLIGAIIAAILVVIAAVIYRRR